MGKQYTELMSFDYEREGLTYQAEAYVNVHEVRSGNYSSLAEDPEEYFGIYSYELDYIEEVFVKSNDDDGYYLTEDEIEGLEWLTDAIEEELYQ